MNVRKAGRKKIGVDDYDAQIAELKKRKSEFLAKQAERIGRLAMGAGLGDLDITDAEMSKAFEEVAARFQNGSPDAQMAETSGRQQPRIKSSGNETGDSSAGISQIPHAPN